MHTNPGLDLTSSSSVGSFYFLLFFFFFCEEEEEGKDKDSLLPFFNPLTNVL